MVQLLQYIWTEQYMNKTLYLKDEEVTVWDRARELADDKLSPVIVAALRKFVAEQEAQIKLMERIVIRYNDKATDDRPTAKAFYGRWLIRPEDPYCPGVVNSLAGAIAASKPPSADSMSLAVNKVFESASLDASAGIAKFEIPDISGIDFSKFDFSSLAAATTAATTTELDLSTLAAAKIAAARSANRYRSAEKRTYRRSAASYNPDAGTGIGGLGGVLRKSYAVAVSAKGSVVLFRFEGDPESPSGWLWIFPSFEEAFEKNTGEAKAALYEALQRQGVPVQELDI
jgi:hypothetical protein